MKKLLSAAVLLSAGLATFIPTLAQAQSSASPYTSATRYDAMGRAVGTIAPDPDGSGPLKYLATRTTYDARGNVTKVESGELSSWHSETILPENWSGFTVHTSAETTYDAMNRKLTDLAKDSNGATVSLTQYGYDSLGRLECTAVRMNPAVYPTIDTYNACQLGPEGIGPNDFGPDRITKTVYDAHGQVLQVRKALGTLIEIADVTYSYTPSGQIEQVIDANGNRAEMRYDGHDRQIEWVFPSKQPVVVFDKSDPQTALATAGPLSTEDGDTSTDDVETYTYDKNGNRLSLTKRDGSVINYTYDALNRMTVKDMPVRADLPSYHQRDVHYSYDLRGLQTRAGFYDATHANAVRYKYDGFGRLLEEEQQSDGNLRIVKSQYDKNSNRTRLTYPDNAFASFTYDGLDRLDRVRQGNTVLGGMAYNNRGLASELSWPVSTSSFNKRAYDYDDAGRLDQIGINLHNNSHDVTWDYTRNPASQIRTEVQSNDAYSWDGHEDFTRAYVVNGLNQYGSAGPDNFTYDANGNLTSEVTPNGTITYLYDIENRLVRRTEGGTTTELYYDPLGRLYRLHDSQTGQTIFIYDGNALVAEYNSSGTLLRRYVHGSNIEADDPLIWYEGSAMNSGTRRYVHADPRGSIVVVTNRPGAPIATNSYDEYGIPDTASGDDIATKGRFRYTGQAWIPELGMYYYKARIYSPTLGRFLQTDPIGYEDQYNLYAYVGNDPINGVDVTGLDTCHLNGCGRGEGRRKSTQDAQPSAANDAAGSFIEGAIEFFAGDAIEAIENPSVTNVVTAVVTTLFKPAKVADNAVDAAKKTCCFVAGTLVDTETGLRPIEEVEVGDLVWARDEETGETALKAVTDLIQRHNRVIWELELTGPSGATESFETTDDHPWWIAGQGWKETEELVPGMAVVTRDGRGMVLTSVLETERTEATYNLTVSDFETYFVGERRVLVHNCRRQGFSERTKSEARTRNQQAGQGTEHCNDCGQVVERQQGPNRKGQRIAGNRSEIDHDDRLADGGSNDVSNARVRCHDCHKEKTARENSRNR